MEGFFVTFEGLEGAGKSTQVRLLEARLTSQGYPVLATREPGGTKIGDKIRKILCDTSNRDLTPMAEAFLFSAARAQHVEQVIRPALEEGMVVICDRFDDATLAYQGYGRGVHLTHIRDINSMATWGVRPNLTFYMEIEPARGLQRISRRIEETETPADRIEKENLAFFEKVRNGYRKIAYEEPQRYRVLDGSMNPEALHAKILDLVVRELKRMNFPSRTKLQP